MRLRYCLRIFEILRLRNCLRIFKTFADFRCPANLQNFADFECSANFRTFCGFWMFWEFSKHLRILRVLQIVETLGDFGCSANVLEMFSEAKLTFLCWLMHFKQYHKNKIHQFSIRILYIINFSKQSIFYKLLKIIVNVDKMLINVVFRQYKVMQI